MTLPDSLTKHNSILLLQSTAGVCNTPMTILGGTSRGSSILSTRRIDSLNFVNTSMSSLSIDCQIIRINDQLGANACYLFRNYALAAFEHKSCHEATPLYLNAGDTLIANSNSFKDKFDVLVSYTEFVDPTHRIVSMPLASLKQDIQNSVAIASVNAPKPFMSGTLVYIADCLPDIYNGAHIVHSVPNAPANTFNFSLKTHKQENPIKVGNIYFKG